MSQQQRSRYHGYRFPAEIIAHAEEVFHHLSEEGQLFDEDGQWRTDLRVEDLDVPEGVKLVIERRLKRLSGEARRVLTTAAIAGRSIALGLLEGCCQVERRVAD